MQGRVNQPFQILGGVSSLQRVICCSPSGDTGSIPILHGRENNDENLLDAMMFL